MNPIPTPARFECTGFLTSVLAQEKMARLRRLRLHTLVAVFVFCTDAALNPDRESGCTPALTAIFMRLQLWENAPVRVVLANLDHSGAKV